jgi:hypothetical protein
VADLVSFAKPLPSILNTRKEKKEKKEEACITHGPIYTL